MAQSIFLIMTKGRTSNANVVSTASSIDAVVGIPNSQPNAKTKPLKNDLMRSEFVIGAPDMKNVIARKMAEDVINAKKFMSIFFI